MRFLQPPQRHYFEDELLSESEISDEDTDAGQQLCETDGYSMPEASQSQTLIPQNRIKSLSCRTQQAPPVSRRRSSNQTSAMKPDKATSSASVKSLASKKPTIKKKDNESGRKPCSTQQAPHVSTRKNSNQSAAMNPDKAISSASVKSLAFKKPTIKKKDNESDKKPCTTQQAPTVSTKRNSRPNKSCAMKPYNTVSSASVKRENE